MFAANGAYIANVNAWGPPACRHPETREGFSAPAKKATKKAIIVGKPLQLKSGLWAKYSQQNWTVNFTCALPKGKSCIIDAKVLQAHGIDPYKPHSKTVNSPKPTDAENKVKLTK